MDLPPVIPPPMPLLAPGPSSSSWHAGFSRGGSLPLGAPAASLGLSLNPLHLPASSLFFQQRRQQQGGGAAPAEEGPLLLDPALDPAAGDDLVRWPCMQPPGLLTPPALTHSCPFADGGHLTGYPLSVPVRGPPGGHGQGCAARADTYA